MVRQYPAIVFQGKAGGDGEYAVVFPDLDGCVTSGATPEEAHSMAGEALQLHVDSILEHGEQLPDPTPLSKIYAQCRKEGGLVVVAVPVRLPGTGRAKRINVTMDEDLLADIDRAAAERSTSRSALLAEGARQVLRR
jgi:predicted RNase H-like HicB family nuclease